MPKNQAPQRKPQQSRNNRIDRGAAAAKRGLHLNRTNYSMAAGSVPAGAEPAKK